MHSYVLRRSYLSFSSLDTNEIRLTTFSAFPFQITSLFPCFLHQGQRWRNREGEGLNRQENTVPRSTVRAALTSTILMWLQRLKVFLQYKLLFSSVAQYQAYIQDSTTWKEKSPICFVWVEVVVLLLFLLTRQWQALWVCLLKSLRDNFL